MGFASRWLDERALFPEFIKEAPDENTGIIIVIPACSEPGILLLLDSLASCDEPGCRTEVIVAVNSGADADEDSLRINCRTMEEIESWKKEHPGCFFRLFAFNVVDPPYDRWGVGYARKTGMDEAVRRFNRIDRPDGVIVNLDADCLVARNYFTSVSNELLQNTSRSACSIFFEHPLSGDEFPEKNYLYISWYELHLRYFLRGMKYAGHPFAFHTVGSAVAVKALAYIRSGGMNRRQAGEDFYFIQKLLPAGGYFALNSTTVYPSPRISARVPFGTGATISRLSEENSGQFPTYNIKAFEDLKEFFETVEHLYALNAGEAEKQYMSLPYTIRYYLGRNEFVEKLTEIMANTSGDESFRKRFYSWFNMFRIVKFMNAVHHEIYRKMPVNDAAAGLLRKSGKVEEAEKTASLLKIYRELDRSEYPGSSLLSGC